MQTEDIISVVNLSQEKRRNLLIYYPYLGRIGVTSGGEGRMSLHCMVRRTKTRVNGFVIISLVLLDAYDVSGYPRRWNESERALVSSGTE